MSLTAENTAIVLDSTSDFPEAQERFPNMRVVPLYVRFGEESFRDHIDIGSHDFYQRLKASAELPTTSQPTPQDFLTAYEDCPATSACTRSICRRSCPARSSRHRSPPRSGGRQDRVVDTGTASLAVALLALAIQRRLAAGTTDDEIEAAA